MIPVRRVDLACTAEADALKSEREARLFLRGPIPLPWLQKAARLPGKSLHVAMLIWFRVGCERSNEVALCPAHRRRFGLQRHAVQRALRALERAELVYVARKNGRASVVTVRDVSIS